MENNPQILRKWGYDVLINRFEPLFREILINEVLIIRYGINKWQEGIPNGVISEFETTKEQKVSVVGVNDFFQEIYLWGLKEIALYGNNYERLSEFVGVTSKEKFLETMDELNELRSKIAHSKTFTRLDLFRLIDLLKEYFSGQLAKELLSYIEREGYKDSKDIQIQLTHGTACENNLPIEEYDLDGGFVGRRKEIVTIKKLLYSNQDRVVSITGAGGLGKTAVALKTAYSILADESKPYEAIIWFSAKESRLTPDGIVAIEPKIKGCTQLIKDILMIVDAKSYEVFLANKIPDSVYAEHLNKIFSSQRCLLIIDNLETILKDCETVEFIKSIPRPSQVLITSRKGLGEIERRYQLPDFDEKSALELFRLVAREKNRVDLLRLSKELIQGLVKSVKYYPLLIKWSIGKVCLGADIKSAFTEIYSGKTDIAEFVFNDIFELLSEHAKMCLFGMTILGEKPVSRHILMHLSGLSADEFDDAIRELIITSFIYQEVSSMGEDEIATNYSMLSLTRGFIQSKLDQDKKAFIRLQNKYYELTHQIEQLEKSKKAYDQSLFSLGIKSDEEKIAFNYVKTAKNFQKNYLFDEAEENYKQAIQIAPNFSYALVEYAKFEHSRDHVHEANALFEKAISVDSENFHAFFAYGIALKRQNRITEAIVNLEKARALNPDYMATYNELGRAYSFNGEYEKANEWFELAKREKEYTNYKHLALTISFQANNYRRWAETFLKRNDYDGGLEKLKHGLELIAQGVAKKISDKYLFLEEKQIAKDVAIVLSKTDRFDEAIPYFKICFEPIRLLSGYVMSTDPQMGEAYYYYAFYGFHTSKLSKDEVLSAIKRATAIIENPNYISRLASLKEKVEWSKSIPGNRNYGIVDYINQNRGFGLVVGNNKKYIFFLKPLSGKISVDNLDDLRGRTISFEVEQSTRDPDKEIAANVVLES